MKTGIDKFELARVGARLAAWGMLVTPFLVVAVLLLDRRGRSAAEGDALYVAASGTDPTVIRRLIERIPDLDARDRLGFTPLALMASLGRTDAVGMLLARGAAVDVVQPDLGTPLMLALRGGHVAIARALLERGADVNVQCGGYDALANATGSNSCECVNLALEAGANPRAPGRRYSVLSLAVQVGNAEVMQRLLAAGADPDQPDEDGRTPLINAAEADEPELARLLLVAGADPSRARPDGLTPRAVAQARACQEMLALLDDHERTSPRRGEEPSTAGNRAGSVEALDWKRSR